MSTRRSNFGAGFNKDVEAILQVVHTGAQLQTVYLYPHEVRENLRLAGMALDKKLEMPDFPDPWEALNDPEYVPDFGDETDAEETPDAES